MNSIQRSLRIVHVASGDLWGGAEAQIAQLVAMLNRQPGIELATIVLNEGELANRLRATGIEVLVIDERQNSAFSVVRQMITFMGNWQPDVVHTHRIKENVLGATAARFSGVPACLRTIHGAPEYVRKSWQLQRQIPRLLDRFVAQNLQHCMVAVSDELRESISNTFPRANTRVIHNGIDVETTRAAAQPPVTLEPGCTHVAFIGRLVPVKRVDVFIRAAGEIIRAGASQFRFHVIGDGPLRVGLQELSHELKIGDRCTFHGFVPDTPRWLASMNCMVLTSDHEGLPMTALEAMALGIPVVAHAVGGLVPLLANQQVNKLVWSQKSVDFSDAITSVAGCSYAAAKVNVVPREYRIEQTASEYANLYWEVLTARSVITTK